MQNLIKRRYTQNQDLQRQLNAYAPLMDMLSVSNGINSGKVDDIIAAINQDTGFYEDAAMREGMTPEQYKRMVDLELKYRQAQETPGRPSRYGRGKIPMPGGIGRRRTAKGFTPILIWLWSWEMKLCPSLWGPGGT